MSDKMSAEEFQENLKNGNIFSDGKGKLHFKDRPVSTIKKTAKKIKEDKIDLFCKLLKQELNIDCVREYQFCPERKWRADYALLDYKILIEQEGSVWNNGRHTRGQGYINDAEKYSTAASMGFIVIRATPQDILSQRVLNLIKDSIKLRETAIRTTH